MPAIVNYEVYVLEGTEWNLHARFPGDERKQAIEEAQTVESMVGKPTKVLRETWYSESNTSDEAVAYVSPRAKQALAKARAAGGARAAAAMGGTGGRPGGLAYAGTADAAAAAAADGPAEKAGAKDFVLRLSMVMVTSLIIAILGTGIASLFIGQLAGMGVHVGANLSSLLFLVFIALFLLSAVPLVLAYVPLDGLERGGQDDSSATDADAARRKAAEAEREREAKRKASADEKAAAAKAEADKARKKSEAAEETALGHPDPELEARQRAEAEAAARAAADAQAALKKATTETKGDTAAATPPAAEDAARQAREKAEPDPDPATLKYEQDRARMMKFLGAAVRVLRATHPQLDAFNKFGVNLFLSGAAQVLSDRTKQSRRLDLLRETIEVIGVKPKLAESFVGKLDEYMTEPRYVAMAQAGSRAMDRWLARRQDAFDELPTLMKDWNTPATKAAAPTMITIVFTDMVGSTDLTDALGDAGAQEAVRAHNAIVRAVLARLDGREVKHTGDGIMATFAVAANGVAAAIEIQRGVTEHNAANADLPIHLRVGLNAGEAIAEENDYFGATVQLAARLCAFADENQIVCSSIVRDLCAGKAFSFGPLGSVKVKGVKEPVSAYEIRWRRQADLELAEAAIEAPAPLPPNAIPLPVGNDRDRG